MATATRPESKSAFIEQLLRQDPYANFKSVNEAWAASGHDGTISQALVNKMRSEAGLSGNLRTKEKPDTTGSSKSEAPAQVGMKRGRQPKVGARRSNPCNRRQLRRLSGVGKENRDSLSLSGNQVESSLPFVSFGSEKIPTLGHNLALVFVLYFSEGQKHYRRNEPVRWCYRQLHHGPMLES